MITRHRFAYLLLIIASAALLSGCQSAFGPQALARTHPAYNEAIIASINEQMLQNLVRMRYRDVTFFLEISSVTASMSLGASAGVDAGLNFGGGDSVSPSAGLAYSDKPTISYTPLQGEDLLNSILRHLELDPIFVLNTVRLEYQSGVRAVFRADQQSLQRSQRIRAPHQNWNQPMNNSVN